MEAQQSDSAGESDAGSSRQAMTGRALKQTSATHIEMAISRRIFPLSISKNLPCTQVQGLNHIRPLKIDQSFIPLPHDSSNTVCSMGKRPGYFFSSPFCSPMASIATTRTSFSGMPNVFFTADSRKPSMGAVS